MSKFCENCGCVIDENETFCHMCGTPVSSSQEQGTTVLSEDQGTTVLPQDNGSDKNSQYQNQSFTNENTSSNSSDQQNYNDQNSFYSANYNSSSQNNPTMQNNFSSQGNYYSQNPGQNFPFSTEIPKHSFVEAYKLFWQNYVNFNSRSRRSDYWYAILWNLLIGFVGGLLAIIPVIGTLVTVLLALLELASLIPMIALSVRRLQDTGKSGLFFLLNLIPIVGQIVLIVFYCGDSQPGNNQYGENPKYINNNTIR